MAQDTSTPFGSVSAQSLHGLHGLHHSVHSARHPRVRPLSLPGLVAIIYYSVCGGPFGTEDVVSAAGPLLALVGFLVMPLIWSVPEALVAAELATVFPNNSGYVTWVTAAFGPFWGFVEGFLSYLSAAFDNAIYPVLFLNYLQKVWSPAGGGWTARVCTIGFSVVLTLLNYLGLSIVGWSAFALTIFTILPFVYIVPAGMPQVETKNLLLTPPFSEVDWQTYLNVLFWNLNYWDTASTLAGEVQNPRKTFPLALSITAVLVFSSYFLPLFVGVGMSGEGGGQDWRDWHSGSLATLGARTGGPWVKAWVVAASGVSNIGQFMSEQASTSYQLQGMAEWGWLPICFGHRSRFGTPTLGLVLGLVIVLLLSTLNFVKIVDLLNGVYCMAQLLEFAAFVQLRRVHGSLRRPFRVPLRSVLGCALLLFAPMGFCVVILVLPILQQDWEQVAFFAGAPVVGVLLYHFLNLCRRRRWLRFAREPPGTLEDVLALQTPVTTAAPSRLASTFEDVLLEPPAVPLDDPDPQLLRHGNHHGNHGRNS